MRILGYRASWMRAIGLAVPLLALGLVACSTPEPVAFLGTELRSGDAATGFELRNQFGQRVSLSDYEGKVVLLTFLYTSCPDICPLTTSLIRDAHQLLSDDVGDVTFVAVSVDPERDTVEAAHAYSEEWQMTRNWDFLTGERDQLAPIWEAYYIAPSIDDSSAGIAAYAEEAGHPEGDSVGALRQDITNVYLVNHSAPVYLLDREGIMRVLFTLPFEPEALAHDIRLLLKQ